MLINRSSKALVNVILLFFVLSPSSLLVNAQQKNNNLIEDTCKKTPNYALCVSTLKSNPGSSTADVAGLAYIVVETVKAKSIAGLKSITELSRSDPKLKKRLTDCSQNYGYILNDFIPEAEQGPPKFAEDGMNAVADSASQCVKSLRGLATPLPNINRLVHDLSLVAVSIIRTLL